MFDGIMSSPSHGELIKEIYDALSRDTGATFSTMALFGTFGLISL